MIIAFHLSLSLVRSSIDCTGHSYTQEETDASARIELTMTFETNNVTGESFLSDDVNEKILFRLTSVSNVCIHSMKNTNDNGYSIKSSLVSIPQFI